MASKMAAINVVDSYSLVEYIFTISNRSSHTFAADKAILQQPNAGRLIANSLATIPYGEKSQKKFSVSGKYIQSLLVRESKFRFPRAPRLA